MNHLGGTMPLTFWIILVVLALMGLGAITAPAWKGLLS